MIRLSHKQDLAFASIAQESLVSGTIMPSGLQIPREGKWIIKNNITKINIVEYTPERDPFIYVRKTTSSKETCCCYRPFLLCSQSPYDNRQANEDSYDRQKQLS